MPDRATKLPPEVEDAIQFFLYRAQVGTALLGDRLAEEEIRALLEPVPEPCDTRIAALVGRVGRGLRAAYEKERARAREALAFAAAIGEAATAPLAEWETRRSALLSGAPASLLREVVRGARGIGERRGCLGLFRCSSGR